MAESSESTDERSSFSDSDSSRKHRKRLWDSRLWSPVLKSSLKPCVSDWTRHIVEQHLHIFFEGDLDNGESVLQKGNMHIHLTDNQNNYLVEASQFLKFTGTMARFDLLGDEMQLELERLKEQILAPNSECSAHTKIFVGNFVDCMKDLCLKVKEKNGVDESFYTDFAYCFATMCLLKPKCADKVVWENLAGVKKVISTEDLIFCKHGLEQVHSETSFSVIKVKRQSEELCSSSKMARRSYSSSDDQYRCRKSSSMYKRIMGQHAGDLLLNLFSLQERRKKFINCTEYSMPGMIFDGCKVAITTLVIKKTHYDKLVNNMHLDDEDKAVIYSSKFYDTLDERLRYPLMKILIGLNNIPDFFNETNV